MVEAPHVLKSQHPREVNVPEVDDAAAKCENGSSINVRPKFESLLSDNELSYCSLSFTFLSYKWQKKKALPHRITEDEVILHI